MNADRRNFLKWLGVAGCTALTGARAQVEAEERSRNPSPDWMGVLVDTTICIGCRKCEWACNTTHHLPVQPLETFEDKSVFAKKRRPTAGAYTVVNRYTELRKDGNPIDVKVQCFHCNTPACYSSCIVSAYTKQDNGAVTYDPGRCMGCRYCMIACPFQIPAYEYNNPLTPRIRKCTFCFERITKPEGVPACVEICPVQCLTFGKRGDLIGLARQKIREHPDVYTDHIYGEHEAGGTAWLYLASVPFDQLGFLNVGTKPVPRLTEAIQHGIFRYFIPPLSLYSILGGIMWLTREKEDPPGDCSGRPPSTYSKPGIRSITEKRGVGKPWKKDDPAEIEVVRNNLAITPHFRAAPVTKRLMTPGVWLLMALMAAAGVAAYFRFFRGLGTVTNLNNQYPWGIWIGIDVAGGVALAAGGFTTAALAHIFHRERYEPIVRPALLTAMLGYTFVAIGLLFDLGKYYNIWHPIVPRMWSGHSVLFEVGMCVMFYLTVLYIEFMPIVFEQFIGRVNFPTILAWLNEPVDRLLRFSKRTLHRTMSVFIIAGVVLSCLHQSSLGSLLLIAPTKVHPLWWTPILPILFLLSALAVGYPMVVFESMIASRTFGRRPEMEVLSPLAKIIPVILAMYLGFKIGDMAIRDTFRYLNDGSFESRMFLIELVGGVILPLILLFMESVRRHPVGLFIASTLIILGVALNRINVFITAYSPPYAERPYFPAIGEIIITAGLIACLIFFYRLIVTHFPVLGTHGPYVERNRSC